MIFAGVRTTIMIVLPETYALVILLKKENNWGKKTRSEARTCMPNMKNKIGRHPPNNISPVSHASTWAHLGHGHHLLSVVYGLLFGCKHSSFPSFVFYNLIWTNISVFEAFPIIFIDGRGFTVVQEAIGVGIVAWSSAIILQRTIVNLPRSGFPPPEIRLFGAMIGSPILVIGIFWMGWTGQYTNIPWYVPALSTTFFGAGISLIFMSFLVRWQLINIPTDLYFLSFSNSRVTSSIHICRSRWCIWFHEYISHFLYRL